MMARFDTVLAIGSINKQEARYAGRAALQGLNDCAEQVAEAGCEILLRKIASDFWTDLQGWWASESYDVWTDCGYHRDDCIGRWESRGGKYWVELHHGRYDYSYRSGGAGGSVCVGNLPVETALMIMQNMLDRNWFLPSAAVIPMKRVDIPKV
jgi:hypothetical protein